MSDLRIFSYLPNPRLMKATIAARLCGVEIEVLGDQPRELPNWLWDFDAHYMSGEDRATNDSIARESHTGFEKILYKTDSFLRAHPFGNVPAAFSPDGKIGVFESNSILRSVARIGEQKARLYGNGPYEASRIDSFLDVTLIFARQSQIYLLSLSQNLCSLTVRNETAKALDLFFSGIELALQPDRSVLVGDRLSIADICVVCEICQIARERAHTKKLRELKFDPIYNEVILKTIYPTVMTYFTTLSKHESFAPDIQPLMQRLLTVSNQ